MKTILAGVICLFLVACNSPKSGSDVKLSSKKDTVSYAIGMNIGKNVADQMNKQPVDVDRSVVSQGFHDAIAGGKAAITEAQAQAAMTAFQQDLATKHEAEQKALAEKSKNFLEENKKKDGVVTLPDGLQYKIVKAGNGVKPKTGQTVTVNYVGKLVDGTEFDSSVKRGQPAEFKIGEVIAGWNEALQLMPVGSKWELYIPPALAYGERGTPGGPIGPNATLIFEVDLLGVK